MVAPKLNEYSYAVFSTIYRTWPLNKFFTSMIRTGSDVNAVSRFAVNHLRIPTFYPIVPPTHQHYVIDEKKAAQFDINDFAAQETQYQGFHFWSAADFVEAYRSGRKTPLQVAKSIIAAIKKSDEGPTPLRIFINYNETDILEQATASTERYKNKATIGVLDGVPIAVKDELEVKGYPRGFGTKGNVIGVQPEQEDSIQVKKMRDAGAMIIGITNMQEFGTMPFGYNTFWGHTRNPYDTDRITGGSSSGSASAVAAGLCPIALGADGGGSIRIPAALCGVVGLKATYSRIALASPVSVVHRGPITSTVKDAAVAYAILAGPDVSDKNSMLQPPVHLDQYYNTSVVGLKIGVDMRLLNSAQPNISSANFAVLQNLKAKGAKIVDVSIKHLQLLDLAHKIAISSEFAAMVDWLWVNNKDDLLHDTIVSLSFGNSHLSKEYIFANMIRSYFLEVYAETFKEVDILFTPATAITAPLIGSAIPDAAELSQVMRYITSGNFLGLPAIVLPVGYDDNRLPIASQLIASHWREDVILRVANVIEQMSPKQKPVVFFDVLE